MGPTCPGTFWALSARDRPEFYGQDDIPGNQGHLFLGNRSSWHMVASVCRKQRTEVRGEGEGPHNADHLLCTWHTHISPSHPHGRLSHQCQRQAAWSEPGFEPGSPNSDAGLSWLCCTASWQWVIPQLLEKGKLWQRSQGHWAILSAWLPFPNPSHPREQGGSCDVLRATPASPMLPPLPSAVHQERVTKSGLHLGGGDFGCSP